MIMLVLMDDHASMLLVFLMSVKVVIWFVFRGGNDEQTEPIVLALGFVCARCSCVYDCSMFPISLT